MKHEIPDPDRPLPVRYMPQLDALRALAVIAVWFEHWWVKDLPVFRWFPWGSLGVWLFFVLSGFLITGILLRARDAAGAAGGFRRAAKNFYIRRFLRILPIYYLALFVMTALAPAVNLPGMRRLFWFQLTYTTNLYFSKYGFKWNSGGHFWTLAVEEQFYLVWPWIILLTPRKHLLKAIILAAAAGVVSRIVFVATHHGDAVGMFPTSCLDQFALGAMLAVLGHEQYLAHWADRFRRVCLLAGLPLLAALLVLWARRTGSHQHPLNLVINPLACAMVFAWLIGTAAGGFSGIAGAVLEWRPLLFLGRISYGLYVYHPFVLVCLVTVLAKAGKGLPAQLPLRFALLAGCTIVVATMSWFVIERPINSLKRWFRYGEGEQSSSTVAFDHALAGSVSSAVSS